MISMLSMNQANNLKNDTEKNIKTHLDCKFNYDTDVAHSTINLETNYKKEFNGI